MNYLITGAAGFIGSHLCERLLADGHQVVALDNFDPFYAEAAKRANLAFSLEKKEFRFVEGDVRDGVLLDHIFQNNAVDAVVHLAAKAGVRPSLDDPACYLDVNVRGTLVLLEAMRRARVGRLLFASSSSVYGNQAKMPFAETDDVGRPISPYAASKRSAELLAHTWRHLYDFDVACVRLFTVYGPRQRPDLAIHKFVRLALAGQPIPLYGDGSTRRDYTYVSDIVDGIARLLQQPGAWGYGIFNLGNGTPVTLLDMVRAVEKALGKTLEIHFLDQQPGDVEQTHADIGKAAAFCGYAPKVSLEEGVGRFVEWFREIEKLRN